MNLTEKLSLLSRKEIFDIKEYLSELEEQKIIKIAIEVPFGFLSKRDENITGDTLHFFDKMEGHLVCSFFWDHNLRQFIFSKRRFSYWSSEYEEYRGTPIYYQTEYREFLQSIGVFFYKNPKVKHESNVSIPNKLKWEECGLNFIYLIGKEDDWDGVLQTGQAVEIRNSEIFIESKFFGTI